MQLFTQLGSSDIQCSGSSLNLADMFLALDKDMNGTLSKQELREYADGTLTDIFIERGKILSFLLMVRDRNVQVMSSNSYRECLTLIDWICYM